MLQDLSRRQLVQGLATTMTLAAVLADPKLTRAAADSLETVSLTTGTGRTLGASLARPVASPAPAVMLVHEWWGLNDQIKAVAAEFARAGYLALAIDLYQGKSADTREDAEKLMKAVDSGAATETCVAWLKWLKADKQSTGKVATVGWCFGGAWSLNASMAEPVDATVVYYGRVDRPAEQLKALKGPVLGHFATKDAFINRPMVEGFEAAMTSAGKSLTVYWYEADHAFANPSGARYDAEDAQASWRRTIAFLEQHVKG